MGRGVEVANTTVPRRIQNAARVVVADRAVQVSQLRAAKPQFGQARLSTCPDTNRTRHHPFTAPTVWPRMRKRWAPRNTMSSGIIEMTVASASCGM